MNTYRTAGVSLLGVLAIPTAILFSSYSTRTLAHCQVPCGIYDDSARIKRLHEDVATIAKAVTQINELAGSHEAQGFNQAARWVATKEQHASHVIEVVSQYFLTQKVKPVAPSAEGYEAYLKTLADHHAVMVAAMKTKQTVDQGAVDALESALDTLATHYK